MTTISRIQVNHYPHGWWEKIKFVLRATIFSKPHFSISGIRIKNISFRDQLELQWIEEFGASDKSLHKFHNTFLH
jgi:hypothetical protein